MRFIQANRESEVITPLGDDVLLLREMNFSEELGRLFHMDLTLFSEQQELSFEDLLAQVVTVRLDIQNESRRYFNGHITEFVQELDQGPFAVYRATVRPWLWFLTRTADCRIFQGMTVPDIVKQVFRDSSFTDFEDRLSGDYRTWDYCVQYRETDFNFVSRLMEQEGIYYYFAHERDKHTLVLADSYGSHDPLPEYEEIPFHLQSEGQGIDREYIFKWSVSKQIEPGVYALNDFDFERPNASLEVESSIVQSHDLADQEIYDYPGEFVESSDGENYARIRIEELAAQYEQISGASNARGIASGGLFTLGDYPRQDRNREYLVLSASHVVRNDGFFSNDSGSGTTYSNSFSLSNSEASYRSARITPKPVVQGPQTAIVVGPSGEEIHTDEHGRVKLQFHWDRYGRKDENSSCWVRVAQVWAGKNWGGIHIPRIGQEVIVEFLEGDPDRPIVTGRVYNGEQIPPYDLPANKTQSGIKSRSSLGGSGANFNEIRMEDKIGEEQLYIHAEKNQDNVVENDETTNVGHDRTEDVGNNETITIGNDRTESVGNNEDISIGANRTEQVGGNEDITISGNRNKMVGGNDDLVVAGNQSATITGNQTNTVTGNQTDVVIGSYTQNVTGPITIATPAPMMITAQGGFTVAAPGGTKTIDVFFNQMGGSLMETFGVQFQVTQQSVTQTVISVGKTEMKMDLDALCVSTKDMDLFETLYAIGTTAVDLTTSGISLENDSLKVIK